MGMVEPEPINEYDIRVMLPSNQGRDPDPITLNAAVYLMLSGVKVAWEPRGIGCDFPWEVERDIRNSAELRAEASKKGWVYLP
jgi:hypothetical protein